jgi:hypothetical protein
MLGIRGNKTNLQKPWEVPHDKAPLGQKVSPSSLFTGASFDSMLMVNDSETRKLLCLLVELRTKGTGVSAENMTKLRQWVSANRAVLLPYIRTSSIISGETSLEVLHESLRGLTTLLAHWASPASEIILLPAPLMATISQIIATKQVTIDQNALIGRLSEGMCLLVLHDRHEVCVQASSGSLGMIHVSDQLVRLLVEIQKVAQSTLKGDKGTATTLGWPRISPAVGEEGASSC